MIKIGIVGVGVIGSELARKATSASFRDDVRLVGVCDINRQREDKLRRELGLKNRLKVDELIRECDLVIEAAGPKPAYEIAEKTLSLGKDVMIMSAAGIVHRADELYQMAKKHRSCVYLPSGAIAGLDGLKSAHAGHIRSVRLVTRKPPASLDSAPYVVRNRINLKKLRADTKVFEGNALEASRGFPQNINIAATLSLAGIGPRKTRVSIYACPGLKFNVHEIEIKGDFGTITTVTRNKPAPQNPKTSHLAVLSAIATLRRILDNVKVGT